MGERHRIFVPQALGSEEFLRVTWHEGRQLIVFSHWDGARCVAATPVRVADVGELAELIVSSYTRTSVPVWPAPDPGDLIALELSVRSA